MEKRRWRLLLNRFYFHSNANLSGEAEHTSFSVHLLVTSPRSCRRRCPICHELLPKGYPVSACLQAAELCPSWPSPTSPWCRRRAVLIPVLSETPGEAEKWWERKDCSRKWSSKENWIFDDAFFFLYLVLCQLYFDLIRLIGDLQLWVQPFLGFF